MEDMSDYYDYSRRENRMVDEHWGKDNPDNPNNKWKYSGNVESQKEKKIVATGLTLRQTIEYMNKTEEEKKEETEKKEAEKLIKYIFKSFSENIQKGKHEVCCGHHSYKMCVRMKPIMIQKLKDEGFEIVDETDEYPICNITYMNENKMRLDRKGLGTFFDEESLEIFREIYYLNQKNKRKIDGQN